MQLLVSGSQPVYRPDPLQQIQWLHVQMWLEGVAAAQRGCLSTPPLQLLLLLLLPLLPDIALLKGTPEVVSRLWCQQGPSLLLEADLRLPLPPLLQMKKPQSAPGAA